MSKFENVEALEKELGRAQKEVERLTALFEALTKRDELKQKIEKLAADKHLAKEKEWRDKVTSLQKTIDAIGKTITDMESAQQNHRDDLIKFGNQKESIEKQYRQVLIRYEDCNKKIAIFNASPKADAEIPDDFDSAVSFYLHDYGKQLDLTHQLEMTFGRLGVFADRYKSNNEAGTTQVLEQELDALPKREEALQLRWSGHIHGLKSNFDSVLGIDNLKTK